MININDLTYGQLKDIAEMMSNHNGSPSLSSKDYHIGEYCIIRTYASGVHAGTVKSVCGRHVALKNSRRLFKWCVQGKGISLSDAAVCGLTPESKICETTPEITLLDALEIIPVSSSAINSIQGAETYHA